MLYEHGCLRFALDESVSKGCFFSAFRSVWAWNQAVKVKIKIVLDLKVQGIAGVHVCVL